MPSSTAWQDKLRPFQTVLLLSPEEMMPHLQIALLSLRIIIFAKLLSVTRSAYLMIADKGSTRMIRDMARRNTLRGIMKDDTGCLGDELVGCMAILSVGGLFYLIADTAIADGTIGGTITVKMAPVGFAKEFSGTNLAAYRSSDLASSSRCYLRVDDTAVQNARILSYESMTDVNTGTNPMPTAVQLAGGAYLYKSNTTDTTARRWMLVGDGRLFHFWWFNGSYFHSMSFGEFISWRPGDAFNTLLAAQVAPNSYCGSLVYGANTNSNYATSYGGGLTLQRGNDQLATSVLTCVASLVYSSGSGGNIAGASGYAAMAYPSDVTGGFELCPVYVRSNCASQNSSRRGIMPGVYHSSADMSAFDEQEIGGIPSNPGALFLSWPIQCGSGIGRAQIDMIGPWR